MAWIIYETHVVKLYSHLYVLRKPEQLPAKSAQIAQDKCASGLPGQYLPLTNRQCGASK